MEDVALITQLLTSQTVEINVLVKAEALMYTHWLAEVEVVTPC